MTLKEFREKLAEVLEFVSKFVGSWGIPIAVVTLVATGASFGVVGIVIAGMAVTMGLTLGLSQLVRPDTEELQTSEEKNEVSDDVKAMTDLIDALNKQDVAALTKLSVPAAWGTYTGKNGVYLLMRMLDDASVENSKQSKQKVDVIAATIKTLIVKCDAALLSSGLAEKTTQPGAWANTNGWHCLIHALHHASKENVDAISNVIVEILARLDSGAISNEQKKMFFSDKQKLLEPLKAYLKSKSQEMPVKDFERMCGSDTMLGALIDHHSSVFGRGKTGTRDFVEKLIQEKNMPAFQESIRLETESIRAAIDNYVEPAKKPVIPSFSETPKVAQQTTEKPVIGTVVNESMLPTGEVIGKKDPKLPITPKEPIVGVVSPTHTGLFARRHERVVPPLVLEEPAVRVYDSRPVVPIQHTNLSKEALLYAEIFCRRANAEYAASRHHLAFHTNSVYQEVQEWKRVLSPDEIKIIKQAVDTELAQAKQAEIDRLVRSAVVPKGSRTPTSKPESTEIEAAEPSKKREGPM